MVGSLVFPPSHTQVDWRLYVEGEEEADAAALLADVFGGDAAEDADEAAAAPACGWPRDVRRGAAGAPGRGAGRTRRLSRAMRLPRFAALVRILVAPRTPGAIVDAAVEALGPTTAAEFSSRAQDDVESTLREGQVSFPSQKAKYLVGAAEVCARSDSAATSRAGRATCGACRASARTGRAALRERVGLRRRRRGCGRLAPRKQRARLGRHRDANGDEAGPRGVAAARPLAPTAYARFNAR